jgi:hypothetical protein
MRRLKAVFGIIGIMSVVLSGFMAYAQWPGKHRGARSDRSNLVFGQVVAIGTGSITIRTKDGATQEISVTDKTAYIRNRQPASLSDFKVSDYVVAHGAPDASGQFVADRVIGSDRAARAGRGHSNRVFGEVISVDAAAGTITVRGRDGATQVIYTTSSTVFSRNRQPATIADFKAGDRIFAHGARGASGQFVADRVFGGEFKARARGHMSMFGQVLFEPVGSV